MKKVLVILLAVVLSIGSAASFIGCGRTFSIEYIIEGVDIPDNVETTMNVSVDEIALWVPVAPNGKVFDGWYEVDTFNGFKSTVIPALNSQNKKYYGRMVDSSYSITYHLTDENGQPASTDSASVISYAAPYSSAVTLWKPTAPLNHSFDGWYTNPQFTGSKTFQIPAADIGDKEFYGRFVEGTGNDYSIRYFINGEEKTSEALPDGYSSSETAILLWIPTFNVSEYSFDGWYTDTSYAASTKTDRIPANASGNKSYYGRYREPEGYGIGKKKMVDFTARDKNGVGKALSSSYGVKPVVINIWATWCGPCQVEMPDFERVYGEMGDKIEFMMVNAGYNETQAQIDQFFVDYPHYTFPIYVSIDPTAGKNAIYTLYNVTKYPTTFFVDKWGYETHTFVGTISEIELKHYLNKSIEATLVD